MTHQYKIDCVLGYDDSNDTYIVELKISNLQTMADVEIVQETLHKIIRGGIAGVWLPQEVN